VSLRAAKDIGARQRQAARFTGREEWEQALAACDAGLAAHPADAGRLARRAALLRRLGRPAEALEALDALLRLRPADPEILTRRAQTLIELERRHEALATAEQALGRDPDARLALNARGMALERLGRYGEALADFDRMLALRPGDLDALNNRALVLARWGRFEEALAGYSRSLSLRPHQPQALYNRSIVRLALGDWTRGLKEFESRWSVPPLSGVRLETSAPLWLGQPSLVGKTLLVHHEQGYGDTLQCARYIPRLSALGARVVFAVPPALCRLMRTVSAGARVISLADPLPDHDFHCPLMSLLLAFGITPETVVAEAGYLSPPPELARLWRERLGARRRPTIGLLWSGRRYPPVNYCRDMSLAALEPLIGLDADFVGLQMDLTDEERATVKAMPNLDCRLAGQLGDFADTAALVAGLDLVISVDTAVAHLAGALGKPVWLLNRYASCWRWLQEGPSSLWYSSMRVFRQPSLGDWGSVVREVRAAAAELIERHGHSEAPAAPVTAADGGRQRTAAPCRRPVTGTEKIRFVCATRQTQEGFFSASALGRSLPFYRTFPPRQRIELRLFKENTQGLPAVYNTAIEEAKEDPAILVFIHDDVFLSDYYWAEHLLDGLRVFDIVGLAGNRRRAPGQASWMYLNGEFQRDRDENLSGVIGHGEGFPNLVELSVYGPPGQQVALLDGVMLAVRSEVLIESGLQFDPRFAFDFYDLDFCRQAELRGLRMGTWAISLIHASSGHLGVDAWQAAYRDYLVKYGEA
jgi:Flp pilus assembly protein TadD